ncbi:glycosyltransferase [Brevibacterium sp.]|uniref:glycosyltransferase n=1 Tax=Brevibacterium sp. TaxID=1701 RepID=UPI0025BE78B3|nr:glycosyltransferase [Brevibacterium sp.]
MVGTVAVWKRSWLPASETFVRNQQDALSEWTPVSLGLVGEPSPLARETDVLLLRRARFRRLWLRLASLIGWSWHLERYLRANRPDVLHAHFVPEAVVASRACARAGVPLVVTVHGHDVTAAPRTPGLRGIRYRRRARRMLRRAARVVAVSEFTARKAVELGAAPDSVVVQPIGIPLPDDRPPSRPEPEWDVVFVGRLVEVKGVQDLVAAVGTLAAQGRPVRVAVVGDGPLRGELERQAAESAAEIEFLGRLSPADVRSVLRRSRIFCAPSRTAPDGAAEGFGMVYLEAAAEGLPVVAYAHGGVPEAVADGRTGLLAAEGDRAGLTAHIGALLEDEGRARELGEAGRARIEREFDVRTRTRGLEQIYAAVCAQPRDHGRK